MSSRHISSVRCAVVAGVMLLIVLSAPVNAQQQTGRVAPQTRNPQTNLAEPLQQQTTGIQSTGSDQVLKQPQSIQIPAGQPARSSEPGDDSGSGLGPLLALIGLLGIVFVATFVRYRSRRDVTVNIEPEPQPMAIREEPTESVVQKKAAPKKKKRPANRPAKKHKKK